MTTDFSLLWTYAGEIGDPEQGSITRSVWTCAACHALVSDSVLRSHERWHLALDLLLPKEDS